MKTLIILCLLIVNLFAGEHVGNGMVSPNDISEVWGQREAYYAKLLKSNLLSPNEKVYLTKLLENAKKEVKAIEFKNLKNDKTFYKADAKIGSPIVFNLDKLSKSKKSNHKDAILLILMAQKERYKIDLDMKELKAKISKSIK